MASYGHRWLESIRAQFASACQSGMTFLEQSNALSEPPNCPSLSLSVFYQAWLMEIVPVGTEMLAIPVDVAFHLLPL